LIYKLSKDNCPYCNQLEGYLKTKNMQKYNKYIVSVHKEKDPEKYNELVEKGNVLSLPVLMREDGTVLTTGFNIQQINLMLKREFGE